MEPTHETCIAACRAHLWVLTYPGGQANARLPSKCTCKCGTLSPASGPLLITTRYPDVNKSSFSATLRDAISNFPSNGASVSVVPANLGITRFGTINT